MEVKKPIRMGPEAWHKLRQRKAGAHRDKRRRRQGKKGRQQVKAALRRGEWE